MALVLIWLCVSNTAHAAGQAGPAQAAVTAQASPVSPEKSRMWMSVGNTRFAITLADTEAAHAFGAMLPMVLETEDLNGNEKHVQLSKALPTAARSPGRIQAGDLMLYGSRTFVLFYLTFDSSYAYTRLGRVEDPAGLAAALGKGSARLEFARQ